MHNYADKAFSSNKTNKSYHFDAENNKFVRPHDSLGFFKVIINLANILTAYLTIDYLSFVT